MQVVQGKVRSGIRTACPAYTSKDSQVRQEQGATRLFMACKDVAAKLSLEKSALPQLESLVSSVAQLGWPYYKQWMAASSAACNCIVSRLNSKPLSLTDCAIAASCLVSDAGRVFHQIVIQLGLEIPPNDPVAILWRICSFIVTERVSVILDCSVKISQSCSAVHHTSCSLFLYAEKRWILTGRKPISVAAAAVVAACIAHEIIGPKQRNELFTLLEKHLHISYKNIRQRYNELMDTLLQDACIFPWSPQLDKKNVHQNLLLILTILGFSTNSDWNDSFTLSKQGGEEEEARFLPPCFRRNHERTKRKRLRIDVQEDMLKDESFDEELEHCLRSEKEIEERKSLCDKILTTDAYANIK
eukprot:jgi/Galph1/5289/GphlegSOOS_G3994.1